MNRKALATVVILLATMSTPGRATEDERTVSVRIAKTKASIAPFGTVTRGGRDARVRLRLYKETEAGSDLLATAREPVKDGTYRTRFERPTRGECRVTVNLVGSDAGDTEFFPCYIPDFGAGTASLSSVTSTTEIDALIASNSEQHQYGLMYRPRLRSDLGMAFVFDNDTSGGFWMKNTLIPLSIAFVDSNDFIVRIMDMEPCTEDPCPTYEPGVTYRVALEVNQGAFEDWDISEGDRIEVTSDP